MHTNAYVTYDLLNWYVHPD